MAAGINPIYTSVPDISANGSTTLSTTLTTATGDYTGVSGNHVLEHTAGANGSYVIRLRLKALGTNVATVARIYINNGSTNGTAANNSLFGEISLPATTATNTAATVDIDYPMNLPLGAGDRIYVGLATTVAAGWSCIAIAGQY